MAAAFQTIIPSKFFFLGMTEGLIASTRASGRWSMPVGYDAISPKMLPVLMIIPCNLFSMAGGKKCKVMLLVKVLVGGKYLKEV